MEGIQLNKAIFTTRYVVHQSSTIVLVVHDNDDDWQFLGNEDITTEDMMIISMEQMLSRDSTLYEVLSLPLNKIAQRADLNNAWVLSDYKE